MRLRLSVAYGLVFGTVLAGPALAVEHEAPELPFMRSAAPAAPAPELTVVQSDALPATRTDAPRTLTAQADAVRMIVQKRLGEPFKGETKFELAEHGGLVQFYEDNGNAPVWVDENGLNAKASAVIQELRKAADYGLNPSDYDLPQEVVLSSVEGSRAERLAEIEFKMSHAALAYARHARGGRKAPQEITYNLDPTLDIPDPLRVMEELAQTDDAAAYLRSFQPKHPQFEALRQVLLRMRGGSSASKEKPGIMIPSGPSLRPGATNEQIVLLRKRLKVAVPDTDADKYDAELVAAVKKFQKSRGLSAEGIVGPLTRRALNGGGVAPKSREKTILANMERWRWVPNNLDKLNVMVNIPEFRYRVYDGEEVITDERIVVGRPKNQTPIFSDSMKFLVFQPYWNVPNSIKRAKIIPLIQQDRGGGWFRSASARPRVLEQQNMFVSYKGKNIDASKVNWNKVNVGLYRFYQMPGPNNAMGAVKFKFPNKHIVYMHDTPTKSLFDKTVRAYSYGCVRVRNPRKLAEILMTRTNGWSKGRVAAAFKGKSNQRANLKTPVPVNITYFTARVEKSGKVTYFADIYGHDTRMARALNM